MSEQDPLTFICRLANGTSTHIDLALIHPSQAAAHALRLLSEHRSAVAVEVWRGDTFVRRVERPQGRHRAP